MCVCVGLGTSRSRKNKLGNMESHEDFHNFDPQSLNTKKEHKKKTACHAVFFRVSGAEDYNYIGRIIEQLRVAMWLYGCVAMWLSSQISNSKWVPYLKIKNNKCPFHVLD